MSTERLVAPMSAVILSAMGTLQSSRLEASHAKSWRRIMLEMAGLAVMAGTIVIGAVILWKFVGLFE